MERKRDKNDFSTKLTRSLGCGPSGGHRLVYMLTSWRCEGSRSAALLPPHPETNFETGVLVPNGHAAEAAGTSRLALAGWAAGSGGPQISNGAKEAYLVTKREPDSAGWAAGRGAPASCRA